MLKDKKIKNVKLIYENCDSYTIEKETIEYITLNNINLNIFNNVFSISKGCGFYFSSNDASLSLNKFKMDDKIYDEIKNRKDLTHIGICFYDKTNVAFSVISPIFWNSWLENPYQLNYEDKDILTIEIKKRYNLFLFKQLLRDFYYQYIETTNKWIYWKWLLRDRWFKTIKQFFIWK